MGRKSKSNWFTFFVYSHLKGEWEQVAIVKSEGLANIALQAFGKVYKSNELAVKVGKNAQPPTGKPV